MIDLLTDSVDDDSSNVTDYMEINLTKFVDFFIVKNNNLFVYTSTTYIRFITRFVSNSYYLKLNMLIDLTAVDYPSELKRFKIVYLLGSLYYLSRVFVFFFTNSNTKIPSITNTFNCAN
jgi:NADH:ubiquinone oxidoreductase subunit C